MVGNIPRWLICLQQQPGSAKSDYLDRDYHPRPKFYFKQLGSSQDTGKKNKIFVSKYSHFKFMETCVKLYIQLKMLLTSVNLANRLSLVSKCGLSLSQVVVAGFLHPQSDPSVTQPTVSKQSKENDRRYEIKHECRCRTDSQDWCLRSSKK